MQVEGKPRFRALHLTGTVHSNPQKPGTLYRLTFSELVPDLFPYGCTECYFIIPNPGEGTRRGAHSHPVGTKAEIFHVIQGRVRVHLHSKEGCGTVTLEQPDEALVVLPGVWHEVEIEAGSVLQVYASLPIDQTVDLEQRPCQCSTT